jgi:hypothetical protein
MKTRKTVYLIFVLLFIIGSVFSVIQIIADAHDFKENREKYTQTVILHEGLLKPSAYLPFGEWEAKVKKADIFKARSNRAYDRIVNNGLIVTSGALFLIVLTLVLFHRKLQVWKYLAGILLVVSVVALVIGVTTPLMEIAAFNEDISIPINANGAKEYAPEIAHGFIDMIDFNIDFEGRTYYFYQTKSILGLIKILFTEKNYTVGIAILLFSLILPIVKLTCSFGQLLSFKFANNKIVNFITNKLGKWSMADVFVVSIFLAYLSFKNIDGGVEMQTELLFGLYCFGSYVILSLLATHFINRASKAQKTQDISELPN